jgi:hypothetical protein
VLTTFTNCMHDADTTCAVAHFFSDSSFFRHLVFPFYFPFLSRPYRWQREGMQSKRLTFGIFCYYSLFTAVIFFFELRGGGAVEEG